MGVAVLGSGSGEDLDALVKARCEVFIVVSNKKGAQILEVARRHGLPTKVVETKDKADVDKALLSALEGHDVGLAVLTEFNRLVGRVFLARYRAINAHPSLLPAFAGMPWQETIRSALAAGVKETGVTVHFVDEGVDTGPIIAQERVPVEPGDTEESLGKRVRKAEGKLLANAIKLVSQGKQRF
jgi:formyltetrahydrofolate-dependent phosphoribosylglycinamide formyltransferase